MLHRALRSRSDTERPADLLEGRVEARRAAHAAARNVRAADRVVCHELPAAYGWIRTLATPIFALCGAFRPAGSAASGDEASRKLGGSSGTSPCAARLANWWVRVSYRVVIADRRSRWDHGHRFAIASSVRRCVEEPTRIGGESRLRRAHAGSRRDISCSERERCLRQPPRSLSARSTGQAYRELTSSISLDRIAMARSS